MKVTIGKYPKDHKTERKIKVKIDNWDLWSLDHTLALVILPSLKLYREKAGGHPCNLTLKKWHAILDKMITAFELIVCDDVIEDETPIKDGLKLFAKYYRNLWD
jgi:hypothetical protein